MSDEETGREPPWYGERERKARHAFFFGAARPSHSVASSFGRRSTKLQQPFATTLKGWWPSRRCPSSLSMAASDSAIFRLSQARRASVRLAGMRRKEAAPYDHPTKWTLPFPLSSQHSARRQTVEIV